MPIRGRGTVAPNSVVCRGSNEHAGPPSGVKSTTYTSAAAGFLADSISCQHKVFRCPPTRVPSGSTVSLTARRPGKPCRTDASRATDCTARCDLSPWKRRTLLSAAVGAHPAAAAFAGSTDHVAAGNSPAAFSITSPELITTIADAAYPYALAADNAGNLFFAESVEDMVFELNHATGAITTVAGNGNQGYGGDGGQATNAELCSPCGVAVNNAGGLFIADLGNSRVREVNLSTGVITTVAGNGTAGNSGDGGQASAAELGQPSGVAVDSAGDLFIADAGNNRIREVNLATGVISTAAGDGSSLLRRRRPGHRRRTGPTLRRGGGQRRGPLHRRYRQLL